MNLKKYIKEYKKTTSAILLAVVVCVIFLLSGYLLTKQSNTESANAKEVVVSSIIDINNKKDSLPLSGVIKSKSEVYVRAEVGGIVRAVYHKLGDEIGAGGTIAVLDNASQQASLAQAQSVLSTAKAQEGKAKLNNSKTSLDEAENTLINTIRGAYSSADDAVRVRIDQFYSNPQSGVTNNFVTSDRELKIDLNRQRTEIEKILVDLQTTSDKLSHGTDFSAKTVEVRANLSKIKTFLDSIAGIVNAYTPNVLESATTINAQKADVATARAEVTGAISSLNGAYEAYNAKKTLNDMNPEDLAMAGAGVEQAQAAVDAAQIYLNKTYLNSPISGTINSLDLEVGDYVSPMQQIAFVSNNSTLEIVTYITEDEKNDISVGNAVTINGDLKGTVSSVAPALDPLTKKIEVKVSVEGNPANLVNGQSVSLQINRNKTNSAEITKTSRILIPLSALKVMPDKMLVFSVSPDNKLVAHEVKDGPISGDKITISGIEPSLKIVTDARGLKEGDFVKIINAK